MVDLLEKIKKASEASSVKANQAESTFVVEALQAKVLQYLFSNMTRDLLVVKGGIAMQLLTGSKRLTSDIDFSAEPKSNMNTIRSHMLQAINSSLRFGLLENYSIREQDVRSDSVSPKFHINGTIPGTNTNIHLKMEISKRDSLPEEAIARFKVDCNSPVDLIPVVVKSNQNVANSYIARTYSPMAMAAAKTAAMLDNNRYKPRDLYDLYLLIEMKVTPPIEMLAAIGSSRLVEMLDVVWGKTEALSYNQFSAEVAPHLPKEISEAISEDEWTEMQLTVGEHVTNWLKSASLIAGEPINRSELSQNFEGLKLRKMSA